jgi:ketosteroid isomerase-like protein
MAKTGDIVKGIYDAFGKGDVPAVLGAFDASIQWKEAESLLYADRNPYVGPQAIVEGVFQRILSDVDNFALFPEHFVEDGDTVVVQGRYRGKVKKTGRSFDAQFAHVWQCRQGKIVGFQQYTDTKQWADALAS